MPSDADLLAAACRDPAIFGEIYVRHAGGVFAYLARRIGTPAAEDLLSDVFLRAFEARDRVRPHSSGSALPWLYGIARNVLLQHLDRPRDSVARAVDESIDWSDVDARLDAGAARTRLNEALAGLSGIEREVLLLVSWEQLSVTEAAQVLGVSPGAARTRLHRARTRASAALEKSTNTREPQEIR